MKKTVSVNIKGTNFLLEEDAYELLQNYLDRLNRALKNEEGSKEIIEDIELRIAEICSSKMSQFKSVIEKSDIEEILDALGDPSDYVEEEEYSSSNEESKYKYTYSGKERRLFRDTQSAAIGGVCAGIANYFHVDVVFIRILFVLFLIFGGFGFPLYIILWIVIPRADSTIDRLRMKGRPITVETVKEEVEEAADRLRTGTRSFSQRMRRDHEYHERIRRGTGIFRSIIGVALMVLGFFMLLGFVLFIIRGFEFIPLQGSGGFMSISDFGALTLNNPSDVKWMWTGGLMSSISAISFVTLLGISVFFKLKNQWTKLALGGLFTLGVIGGFVCGTIGIKAGTDWSSTGQIRTKIGVVDAETLVLVPRFPEASSNPNVEVRSYGNTGFFGVEGDKLTKYGIHIVYLESPDTLFHITKKSNAHGLTTHSATLKSKHIRHRVKIQGDSVLFDVKYTFPYADKLRGQESELIIEIPKGKSVRIGNKRIRLGREYDYDSEDFDEETYDEGYINEDGTYDSW